MKKRGMVCVCLCLLLLAGCVAGCAPQDGKLKNPLAPLTVSILAVEKADAVLIEAPAGTVLIDTGSAATADTVVKALADRGVTALDLLVLTHPGEEHSGGAAAVLNAVSVDRIVATRQTGDGAGFAAYTAACKAKNLTPETPKDTVTVSLGDAVLTLLPAAKDNYKKVNDTSLMATLTYGNHRMVFASDAGKERLAEYLNGDVAACDLLKLPDHGEWVTNTADFIEALTPRYSVITCGETSLPASAATMDLAMKQGDLFLTAYGTVTAVSDGVSLTVTQPEH